MKLKKLLSGVTAAIMVLSSVAITSFTSASAADKLFAKIISNQTTVLAQGTADESLAGATRARFTYKMGPNANWADYTYLDLNLRVGYSEFTQRFAGTSGAANGASGIFTVDLPAAVKQGNTYIIKGSTTFGNAHGEFDYAFGFSKIEFLNDSDEVVKTVTEVGALPDIDPYPGDVMPIRMMDNKSDLCKPIEITGDGEYIIEAKNLNITKGGDGFNSIGLYNSYATEVLDENATITLKEFTLNGNVGVDITDDWKNKSAFENGTLSFIPVNHWPSGENPTPTLDDKIPSEVKTITSIKMKFEIKNTGLSKDKPAVQPAQIIDSITYNFTVIEQGVATQIGWNGQAVDILNQNPKTAFNCSVPLEEGKTEYSATVSGLYCTKIMNLGHCSAAGGDATTEIKVTSVVINNKYTFTVNKVLQPATDNHDLANIWNADGFVAVVPYECENAYLAGSPSDAVGIRLYLGAAPGSTVDPADGLNINLADNTGTQLGDKAVKIEKDGSYELSAEGLKLEVGNCSAGLSAKKANQLIAADSKITLTKLVVNGQEYDITDAWKNISPFDESGNLSVFPINFWNEDEAIIKKGDTLKDGASTISSITIAFDLSATGLSGGQQPGPGDDPKPPIDPPAPTSYEAFLMYCDQGWGSNWSTFKHPETKGTTAAVTGSGTYTVGVGPEMAITEGNKTASGITVMAVDITGYANAIGAGTADEGDIPEADARDIARKAGLNITNVSIIVDNNEVYKYADKDVMFGDIEGNGNIRIDIYNTENESGKEEHENDYDAPQKVQDLADGELEASENIQVKFTISYNKGGNNNSGGTNVKPGKPNNPTVDKKPGTNNTAKKNAENAMKKATIKKLKVNAKKAKKVTVTWNNIKKVNGYKIKGYEVQVSNKSGFGNKLLKKTVKKSKIVIKTTKKIKRGKKYFVRVRAYTTYKDAKGKTQKAFGKWKKSAKFKVK